MLVCSHSVIQPLSAKEFGLWLSDISVRVQGGTYCEILYRGRSFLSPGTRSECFLRGVKFLAKNLRGMKIFWEIIRGMKIFPFQAE